MNNKAHTLSLLATIVSTAFLSSTTFAAPCATSGGGTPLASAALGLNPGEWCQFESGLTRDLLTTCGTNTPQFVSYSDSMIWNPVGREVRFYGSPHNGVTRHIFFKEMTNQWGVDEAPFNHNCTAGSCFVGEPENATRSYCIPSGHGYDNSTVDPDTGDYYVGHYNDPKVRVWREGAWHDLPNVPRVSTGAYEYFPERGGLVSLVAGRGIYFWEKATNKWTDEGDETWDINYHNAIEYNPQHKVMWLMGGNSDRHHYKMNADGSREALMTATSPHPNLNGFGITTVLVAVDSASGYYIVFDYAKDAWWQYDIVNNVWTPFSAIGVNSMPPLRGPSTCNSTGGDCAADNLEASISSYGVIMFVARSDKNGQTASYLYRHAPFEGDATPPSPPNNLEVL